MGGCLGKLKVSRPQFASDPKGIYDYDFFVIGGGSGGIAAAKEAARYGKAVALCDFVKPSPKGTTWGLGGTCVNVGCIPKIMMHHGAILGASVKDAGSYGWENINNDKIVHNWKLLVDGIHDHILTLNWNYIVALSKAKVHYLNEYATLEDNHTIKTVNKKGEEKTFTVRDILIATGCRPNYPDIPGAKEFGITSDDLFSLPYSPGKTLCVGGSYIALESAGVLASFGFDVTVMLRSVVLRGFDQQFAKMIQENLVAEGVVFVEGYVPTSVELIKEGTPPTLKVTGKKTNPLAKGKGVETEDKDSVFVMEFNTVLFAVGRQPCTKNIGLETAKVKISEESGRILTNKADQTSVTTIYAVGDVAEGRPELTPVAVHAGIRLAQRLYNGSNILSNYQNIPTTIFTPLEYGCIGMSEEAAKEKYGNKDVEVFHTNFTPIEHVLPKRDVLRCYAKLICIKSLDLKVVGFHYLGPNAGEVTQGFGLGFVKGVKKEDFDSLIGIHPTKAEVFTSLDVSKSSGRSEVREEC